MYLLRTRFKKDIVCEFLPPIAATHGTAKSQRANKLIILCGGMPSYPGGKTELATFLARKGYWVFIPRYRGSWESGGTFLKISPHQDVLDIIGELPKGFKDLWSGKLHKIKAPEIYLIGSSFGGAAVLLASRDARVKKAIALSPVTDWRAESKTEPFSKLRSFSEQAFGNGYRFDKNAWNKLKSGKFYNPMHEAAMIDGKKIIIIHAKDDKIVYAKTSIVFAKRTGAKILLLKNGGHFSTSNIAQPKFWKEIKKLP